MRWLAVFGLGLVTLTLALAFRPEQLAPPPAPTPTPAAAAAFPPGAVVYLRGTPHLWVADEAGVLHWGGDLDGLAEHFTDWAGWHEVTLTELRAQPRGDPWLSTGLLKLGEHFYVARREVGEASPTLWHIQSLADLDLFGVNAGNYGLLVYDEGAWEQRFGTRVAGLVRAALPAAVPREPR